jgi:hypothetical protein
MSNPEGGPGHDAASTGRLPEGPDAPFSSASAPSPEGEVERLLRAARSALEAGEASPAHFVIPVAGRRWRVTSHDLVATGENDFGIPPRAFSHGAVGMLVASLGARECYAAEAVGAGTTPVAVPAIAPGAPQGAGFGRADEGGFRQALVVTVFAQGRLEVHVQPYGRGGDGELRWGEPTVRSTTEPGPLGAALPLWRAVNREPAPLPPPDDLIADMTESGFVVSVEDIED